MYHLATCMVPATLPDIQPPNTIQNDLKSRNVDDEQLATAIITFLIILPSLLTTSGEIRNLCLRNANRSLAEIS